MKILAFTSHHTRPFLVTLACAAVPLSAQQYVDQRVIVPGSSPGSNGTSQIKSGDIDGDGRKDMVLRLDSSIDWVFHNEGANATEPFTFVDQVDGDDSHDAVFADFDADGLEDYLTQDFVHLGWYEGLSSGQLGGFSIIESEGPDEVYWEKRAGDVDGDGNVDAVVSMSDTPFGGPGLIRLFAGTGGGAFAAPQDFPTLDRATDMVLGDFNVDGTLDLVTTGVLGSQAHVMYGQLGGFAAPVDAIPGGITSWHLATGDFDVDGDADVACVSGGAGVDWLNGGAAGLSFGGSIAVPSSTAGFHDPFVGDLDGDGSSDLLLGSGFSSVGSIARVMGQAGVGLANAILVDNVPVDVVHAIDYDGLPGLDLVYLTERYRYPALRPNDGTGGFVSQFARAVSGTCADADSFCAGDLNGDGALDLAFKTGVWLPGDGAGGFLAELPLDARPSELVDLNGDGVLDSIGLVNPCAPLEGMLVSLGTGGGAFGATTLPPQSGPLVDFEVGDLDADGDIDIVSAAKDEVYTHLNDGTGTFAPEHLTPLPPAGNRRVAIGDIDLDGYQDVARTSYGVTLFGLQAILAWGLSTGDGQLTGVQQVVEFQSEMDELLIDDVTGDGAPDLIFARSSGGQIVVADGDGAGNFAKSVPVASFYSVGISLEVADMNGDGARDLLLGTPPAAGPFFFPGDAKVGVALWNGTEFEESWEIAAVGGVGKVLARDFDADGQIDLAFGHDRKVRVAINRLDDPAGTAAFGTGTPACLGRTSVGTVDVPAIGNSAFGVTAHNLPPEGLGWFGLGNATSMAGVDPLGLGALMHVDPIASSLLEVFVVSADKSGQAYLSLPIPASAPLVGVTVATQAAHFGVPGSDCSTSPIGLSSSRALSVTIQP